MHRAKHPSRLHSERPQSAGWARASAPGADDPQVLPDLPPGDPIEEGADEDGPLGDTPLSDELEKSAVDDLVAWEGDQDETPLDVGVEISDVGDVALSAETPDLVLDMGQLINDPGEGASAGFDDERTPSRPESYVDLDDIPDVLDTDPRDGTDEPLEMLVSEELPGLDSDDREEAAIEYFELGELGAVVRDEPLPPLTALPWTERRVSASLGAMRALAIAGDSVIAGGRRVNWLDRHLSLTHQLLTPRASVVDVASTVVENVVHAVCATGTGEVFRVAQHDDAPVRVEGWRRAAGVRPDEAVTLDLCSSPTPSPVVLGRTTTGRLIRSADGGSSWSGVELHGRVVALSTATTPAVAVLESRGRRRLMLSHDEGLNWRVLEPDTGVAPLLVEDDLLLAATGSTVAVAHPVRGLWICTDGTHFHRIAGCGGVTAITAAAPDGRECLWLSVFEEVAQTSHLVMIDAKGRLATRLAAVQATLDDSDPESLPDHARIYSLGWDTNERLWAAGDFGVTTFTRVSCSVTAS